MSLTTSPALNADNTVAFAQDTKFDGLRDTPFQTLVNIKLPVDTAEVGLGLREMEWVHSAIQVGVARGRGIACHHDDRADWSVLRDKSGRSTTIYSH